MSEISAERVKELREKSGAGFMDCKRALSATAGDLERAIDLLRKEGVVKAAKKSGRTTLEGLIAAGLSPDRGVASLVEVNCETDFVARTDQFQGFISSVAELIVRNRPDNLAQLMNLNSGKATLAEAFAQLIAKVGENISLRRFQLVQTGAGQTVGSYIHAGSKIGVLIKLKVSEGGSPSVANDKSPDLARDVAMHVAAMAPRYLDRRQVPNSVIEREKEITRASPELAGKPAALLDKILEGKINRFFSESCLLEQPFIKDPTGKKTVVDYLKDKAPGTEILEMVRFQVGETLA